MTKRSRLLLVLGLLGLIAPLVPAPSHAAEAGGVGIRLLDAPVNRRDDPRAEVYIVDHVAPGTELTRRIEVKNLSKERSSLQLYPVAAELNATGFKVAEGRTPNEASEWISVTPTTVELAAGAVAVATVRILVPAKASSGERYAAVLAELPAKATGSGTTVSVATRVGIRVYLDVGPGGEPASDYTIESLTARRAKDGTPEVTATVTNTGGRAVDLSGKLTLSNGPGGLRAGPFNVDNLRTLGIGAQGDVLVKLDKALPAGPWTARIDMESGRLKRSASAVITFPATAGEANPPVKAKDIPLAKDRKVLVPVAAGLIVALLLGLLAFWLLANKRAKRRDPDKDDAQ